MKKYFLVALLMIIHGSCYLQTINWEGSYLGSGYDYSSFLTTHERYGVYVEYSSVYERSAVFATTTPTSPCTYSESLDFTMISIGSKGEVFWQECFGGLFRDTLTGGIITNDGGYVLIGEAKSQSWGYNDDYLIIKLGNTGNIEWEKRFGGTKKESPQGIIQTSDGGYVVVGVSYSDDGDVTHNDGGSDYWIVKLNMNGDLEWEKSYGGTSYDIAFSVVETQDTSYIIAGTTGSSNGDITGFHGGIDYWIIKINSSGNLEWEECFGGSNWEVPHKIVNATNDQLLIVGTSKSNDGDITSPIGNEDYWILMIDTNGQMIWQKSLGGNQQDGCRDVEILDNGNFLLVGSTYSNSVNVSGNHGGSDYWVVQCDNIGNILWQKCFGGSEDDFASSIALKNGGRFIIGGDSYSNDGDVTSVEGGTIWVVDLCLNDSILVSVEDSVYCTSTTLTAESGYDSYMWNTGDTTQSINVFSGGTYTVSAYLIDQDCPLLGEISINDPVTPFIPISVYLSDSTYCYSTYLSADTGFVTYHWSNGDTTRIIEVSQGGNYSLIAYNIDNCAAYDTVAVPQPLEPYNFEKICMVTMDEISGKNIVIVEKTFGVGTDSILFYRLDNLTSEFLKIGSIDFNLESTFIDDNAIPEQQSYSYKIGVIDTCGKVSEVSELHRTILLQANSGINQEVNLYWNPYEGFEYPNFEIYRSGNQNPFILIATVPNNMYSFTDLNPPGGQKRYQVVVVAPDVCNPERIDYSTVSSNIVNIQTIGIDETNGNLPLIYPNPATNKINIEVSSSDVNKYERLIIFNALSQVVYSQSIEKNAKKIVVNLGGLPPSIYYVGFISNGVYVGGSKLIINQTVQN